MPSSTRELRRFLATHPRLTAALFSAGLLITYAVPTGNNGVIS